MCYCLLGTISLLQHRYWASAVALRLLLLENKGSCRYIVALFLAHEETELSRNRSYLSYIERCVNVIVKLDYNIKVSALRLKE
jgi:hypothetical protein